jgi:P27 family predicted phage terminase small subunit
MAGRPPKPTVLRIVGGNAGKRPLPRNEPQPARSRPTAPPFLGDAAKAEWDRVAPQLDRLGLLTELDRANLAAYCVAYSDWMEAEEQLRKYGRVMKSPVRVTVRRKDGEEITESAGGFPMQSPYVPLRNKALEQMRVFSALFGMSPVDRTRVSIPDGPAPAKADRSAKYF